jgi:hypothetical protein
MFREEAKARKKLDQEFKDAQDKMVKAAKEDASLRKQVKDLQAEVDRKK